VKVKSVKFRVQLTRRQVTDEAMRLEGVSPKDMSIKPGTRLHADRKKAAKRGYSKHRKQPE
jgi:hypothetical protein